MARRWLCVGALQQEMKMSTRGWCSVQLCGLQMNADYTISHCGLMPTVSDLLGFVQCKLDIRVIRTLHAIKWLCNYIKAILNAAAWIYMLRASLGECEKTYHQICRQQFLHNCKRGHKIAKEPFPITEAELKARNTVLYHKTDYKEKMWQSSETNHKSLHVPNRAYSVQEVSLEAPCRICLC